MRVATVISRTGLRTGMHGYGSCKRIVCTLVFLISIRNATVADEFFLLHQDSIDSASQSFQNAVLRRAHRKSKIVPRTITDKTHLAESGDPRDYHSLSIYWWPVQRSDGTVVYEHRDGDRNPEADQYDANKLRLTCDDAFDLLRALRFLT